MAGIGDALLGIATGAANVINEDAAKDREFMRKQKVKIADSRLVRQEKDYDARKAQWDVIQKYGTDKKGQYMHAYGIFKDHNQAIRAVNAGIFESALKGIKDPGTFVPYDIGLVTDEEVRARYGNSSVAGKIMGAFGNTKTRRADQREGERIGRGQNADTVSQKADQALGLGDFAPVQDIQTSPDTVTSMESTLAGGEEKTTVTTQHSPSETDERAEKEETFFTIPPVTKVERDGDQVIVTQTDGTTGAVLSTKATSIDNYRTFTRPEVDLDLGIATWSVTQSDGSVETFAGDITGLPDEVAKGFKIQNSTYNKEMGGYTILEQDRETKEMKATFLKVDNVPEGTDQSKIKWLSFKSIDPTTGETVTKWVATELVGTGDKRKIQPIDAIQVTTATTTSTAPQAAPGDARNRAFSKLVQAQAGGGDIGDALEGFSKDQLTALSVDVADEAIKMSRSGKFDELNFGQIEQQAILRIVRAEALRQKLRAGKQEQ